MRTALLAALLVLAGPVAVPRAQDADAAEPASPRYPDVRNDDALGWFRVLNQADLGPIREQQAAASGASWDLGHAGYGLSLGNSRRWAGLRVNWSDHAVQDVRGLNLTLWRPRPNVDGRLAGVSLGLWGPRADVVDGLGLGLVSVRARGALRGAWFGGLLAKSRRMSGLGLSLGYQVARGRARGLFVSFVGNHATLERPLLEGWRVHRMPEPAGGWGDDRLEGVALSPGANVHDGGVRGLQLGGLVAVSGGHTDGAQLALLVGHTQSRLRGVQLAGLSGAAGDGTRGLVLGGVLTTTAGDLAGLVGGGLIAHHRGRLRGVGASAGLMHADELAGLGVGSWVTSRGLRGVQLGALTATAGEHRGVSIGLFNSIHELRSGFAVGLLNHVQDNPPWARWLPLFNTAF